MGSAAPEDAMLAAAVGALAPTRFCSALSLLTWGFLSVPSGFTFQGHGAGLHRSTWLYCSHICHASRKASCFSLCPRSATFFPTLREKPRAVRFYVVAQRSSAQVTCARPAGCGECLAAAPGALPRHGLGWLQPVSPSVPRAWKRKGGICKESDTASGHWPQHFFPPRPWSKWWQMEALLCLL